MSEEIEEINLKMHRKYKRINQNLIVLKTWEYT